MVARGVGCVGVLFLLASAALPAGDERAGGPSQEKPDGAPLRLGNARFANLGRVFALAYSAEKVLNDNDDKLPADLKEEVRGKIEELRTALTANDVAQMKTLSDELSEALQKLGSQFYGAAGGPQGPSGGEGPKSGPDEGTVEGEFREV